MEKLASCVAIVALLSNAVAADTGSGVVSTVRADIDSMYPDIEKLYIDLHQNPELSLLEEKTAAKLAQRMRKLGYEVTTQVGGTASWRYKNGPGPTLLIRTDMDALPVLEQTGLPYASKVTQKDAVTGEVVLVMHACGHDVHMAGVDWHGDHPREGQGSVARHGDVRRPARRGAWSAAPRPCSPTVCIRALASRMRRSASTTTT